ncbi:MAG: hypothetical protein HYZ53_29395 [Planctomycetes bacterium]|nr:hypothetical protein [Planctomycetota bacterium]
MPTKLDAETRLEIVDLIDERVRAMYVTREDFTELKSIVAGLAAAQARTEKRVEALAEAQQRTEKRLGELAEAQQRT